FFQAEDGIRDGHVTGVQTCALPIFYVAGETNSTDMPVTSGAAEPLMGGSYDCFAGRIGTSGRLDYLTYLGGAGYDFCSGVAADEIGRASCRERGEGGGGGRGLEREW